MATKPLQIKAKDVYVYTGQVPIRRVQSFDWTSNFTTDSVYELGNAGIVEDSVTLVEEAITMNTNEWGNTDLEAMVFGIYEQRPVVATSGNAVGTIVVAARGAGGDWNSVGNATVGANTWLQVIRTNSSATVNDSEFVKVSSISLSGDYNIIKLSPTYNLSSPATGYDIVSIVNKYTITQDTVDAKPAHFVIPHRQSSEATTLMYSVILPRVYTDNLTYRIDVNGAAEQNYSMVGEEERFLMGSKREVYSIIGSFMDYTGGTVTFVVPKNSMACDNTPYICYADSNMATAAFITHTSGAITFQVNFQSSSLGIDSSTQLVLYTYDPTPRGWKGITNLTSGIGKLTKGYVEILFGTTDTAPEKLYRCTGIDISIPLTRESIDELGESRSIGKPLEGNLRNEITLTLNRNNLREYAMMLDQSSDFDAGTVTELLMTELKSAKTVKIVVKFYNSQTTHSSDTLLKTMTFENCNFIGDNNTTPISGAAGLELKFSTQSIDIVGSGLPPVYSTWF